MRAGADLENNRFEDHFSQQAQIYAEYRPRYPGALFAYVASIAPDHRLAWDCATGNGQAALGLVEHFDRVVATDASREQIAQAVRHERIDYRVESAEEVSLETGTVDLATVAIAVHWFDLNHFYQEVHRVLRAEGILAVWTYHLPALESEIDAILARYYRQVLAGYWPEQIRYIDEHYQTLPFPFEELQPPQFEMPTEWNLNQLLGFLNSWSATRRYKEETGQHPLAIIWPELAEAWGELERQRTLQLPIYMQVGRAGS